MSLRLCRKSSSPHAVKDDGESYIVTEERLTQTDVVGEGLQEAVALLSPAPAARARAPRSHGGRRVVDIVGSYCTSCGENTRASVSIKYSFRFFGRLYSWRFVI